MTPSDDERKLTIVAIVAGVLVLTADFGGQGVQALAHSAWLRFRWCTAFWFTIACGWI